jgi:hypothetical protein
MQKAYPTGFLNRVEIALIWWSSCSATKYRASINLIGIFSLGCTDMRDNKAVSAL